jgi:hypothetical protein
MFIADIGIFIPYEALLDRLNKGVTDSTAPTIDPRMLAVLEKFPFLSYGVMDKTPYLGIIQNCDNQFVSIYVLDLIPEASAREIFLELGDRWWWESNRKIPINVFIKDPRFKQFRSSLRMFSAKDFDIVAGPRVSLAETMNRRIRKRQITLVRPMD